MIVRILILLALCASLQAGEFLARITYYSGSRTASGKKPVQGVTVAAERKYPFGTALTIPELEGVVSSSKFIVQDRGPAVQARKASKGKLPVIDVYVSSQAKVRELSKRKKNVFKVYTQ